MAGRYNPSSSRKHLVIRLGAFLFYLSEVSKMVSKLKLMFYVNPGKTREDDCYCSAYNPKCPKGYNDECILIKHTYNPYEGLEECMGHSSYKRVNGRLKRR